MATLTVLRFPNADGANNFLNQLRLLEKEQIITVEDAAIVSWKQGAKKPKTQQTKNLTGIGALDGAFWGMLFGLIFFVPFFGLAIGAAMGALAGHFADYGIDDEFIKHMRDQFTPGTSGLFLLTSGAVQDRLTERLKGQEFEIISTNLSKEQEEQLRASFQSPEEAESTETPAEAKSTETPA
jgi:uncharacterized membrane protein